MESVIQAVTEEVKVTGRSLKRAEDPRFITGFAKFVDDVREPEMLWAAFVRSSYPHARILSIDTKKALDHPSVVLVLTGRDLSGKVGLMPTVEGDAKVRPTTRHVLALDEVRYEGEAVAVVVARGRYEAVDAAELVEVKYDPLPSVIDPEKSMEPGAPTVHSEVPENIAYRYTLESPGYSEIFARGARVVKVRLVNQRVAPAPLEGRGVVARYDRGTDLLTVHISCQDPFTTRAELAKILKRPEPSIRVVSSDVGGAFGSKISLYPEEVVLSYVSITTGRPVKWVESRKENLLTTTQGRGQVQYAEAAVSEEGRILALNVRIVADSGAYSTEGSIYVPKITTQMIPGCYDIKAIRIELLCALTNKVPQDAYRGAGRPEALFLIERLMNRISLELGLDPVKLRLINFVSKENFPYRNITGKLTYDTGNYQASMMKVVEISKYEELRKWQASVRADGRLVGIGVASYVEVCGFSPSYPQTASLTVTEEGKVIISSGTNPHGQGHHTPFAQIVSDALGVDVSDVFFNHGDTANMPYATSTSGSRSAALGGSAVLLAAERVKEKMAKVAEHLLGTRGSRIMFRDGRIYAEGQEGKSLSFAEVAHACYDPGSLPNGVLPTIFEYAVFLPRSNTFPFGTHIAVVEVDVESGSVSLLRYYAVDDLGRVLNPMVAEGQVHGGVAQGVGQALFERTAYDEDGSSITSTFAEYLLPVADSLPEVKWARTETPTDANPLGVKGVGETGAIASPPAVANAVEDALSQIGGWPECMPLTSDYVWQVMKAGRRRLNQADLRVPSP
jgi:carbon-monoxide dehydrogenase large subunit